MDKKLLTQNTKSDIIIELIMKFFGKETLIFEN